MAQAKNFFDDVKKEIECPVCQEQFGVNKQPKILKCLHTFCKSCLEGLLRQHRAGELSCPTCRTVTECMNNEVDNLPSNLFYKQMVEIVEAYTDQEESSCCGKCEERTSLKFYCSNCNCLLCKECVTLHKKWKDFRGHLIKEIGKLQSRDVEDYSRKAKVCKEHGDEFRFFCVACQICICRDCAILDHDDHNKITLEKGLESKTTAIKNKIREVQANGSHLRNQKESLEKRRIKVNNSFERATNSVRMVAEQWITIVRKHEADMIGELMRQKNSFEAEFSNQMLTLDGRLMEIERGLHFGEDVLSRRNLPEILNVEEMLENRLQELSVPLKPILEFPEVVYSPNDLNRLKFEPGKLIRRAKEPLVSFAEDQGLSEAIRGKESTFTVITKGEAIKFSPFTLGVRKREPHILHQNETSWKALRMEEAKCPLGKDDIVVNKEIALRGIYVTGFPSSTETNELVMHFQRRKHGGGDIEFIHIAGNFAVIIFVDRSVAESVVRKKQFLSPNVLLKVKSLSEKVKIETAKTPEIFRQVSAWICDEVLGNHTRQEIELVLNKVKGETDVEFHDAKKGFELSGNFQQIKQSNYLLRQYFKGQECTDIQPQQYETTPKFFCLFVKVHDKELRKIENDYEIKIHRDVVHNKVAVEPTKRCTIEKFSEGCDAFVALHQNVHKCMKVVEFVPSDQESPVRVRQLIRDVGKAKPLLIEVCGDRKHLKVYGEESFVKKYLSDLQRKGLICQTAQDTGAS